MLKKRSVRSALSAARDAAAAPRAGETRVGMFTVNHPGLRAAGRGPDVRIELANRLLSEALCAMPGLPREAMPRGGSLAEGGRG